MSERKDLYGDNKPKRTLRKAHAVKRSRALRKGVAGVAVASTLAMMLPSVVASALQPTQKDIIDASNTTQKMGKGKPDVEELNMQRWGAGVLKNSAQTQKFVELARHDAQIQQLREAQQREIEQRELNKSEAKQHESQQQEAQQREIDSQLGSSNAVGSVGSAAVSAPAPVQPVQQAQPAVKPESTPILQPTVKPESTSTAKPDAKQPAETKQPEEKQQEAKQPEENAGGVKPAEVKPAENKQPEQPANAQPANTQPVNTESAKPANGQNTSEQSSSTHAENTNTVSDANTPKMRARRSVESSDSASDGSSVAPANNAPATPTAAPASNTTTPSAPVAPTSAESSAGAGTTSNPTAEKHGAEGTTQGNAQGQSSENPTAQGSQSNAQGTNTSVPGEDKSATPSTTGSAPAAEPRSTSNNQPTPSTTTSNAGTPNAGTPGAGTTTTNTATDPNSQVIKPNTDNPTAGSTSEANGQVQTDKKPRDTYNLKIRYTIGGAANKQLVQPYELTIDVEKLNKLDDVDKYEYIELPKAAGYRPSVYHSGTYQYYIINDKGKYVIDDGTNADAVRYLRLSKKLITDYAVKERPAVESNNSAQTSQNPSSSQSGSGDGIQYYGELNINYAPKTAKYYVRHLVQDLKNKDKFEEAPNIGKAIVVEHKTKDKNNKVTTTKEVIHVTEITGTVGSDVTAVSTYIPGYEPENNLISSPLSDSEDEKDKLVLNLRYYRKAYEVTYDSAGGTDVTAQKVYYGQKVPEVPEPTYRGHTFLGWQIVEPGESANRSSTSNRSVTNEAHNYMMPDHDVKFRAAWSANEATSYRVNVWVQKADLVDKEHPDSLVNYDFVGLVERQNVQTDSEVALDKMNDAGVVDDASKLNGASETDYVKNPELGLTKEELQGKDSKHETGLIAKFNWMNDTHVTSLEGYDTTNPGAESNYLKDSSGNYVTGPIDAKTPNWDNRVYKDIFTRYFHVNKDLTKKLNSEQHDFVPGRPDLGKRSKAKLCANDLNNTLNLVYDRKEYELIFAKPAGVDSGDNAAIKRKDENGKTTIYCYAGGGGCSDKYVGKDKDEHGIEINHKGYRVKVRYGQKLTDIWPDVNELYFSEEGKGSLGWQLGFAGVVKYRDTPPYRFTKEEFADPRWRAAFKKNSKDKVIPKISDDPEHNPQVTHELKDNQRLLTADKSNQSQPIQVIIRKQSIASAKKGGDISEDDYELSTDSYSKDDTPSADYDYPAPSIAGFNPADGYDTARVGDALDKGDFEANLEVWYNESHAHGDWDALSEDEQKDFAKKYHLAFRKYRGVPVDEQENYHGDEQEFDDNKPLEFRYDRQKYAVQFYNADGNAIKDSSGAATEKLPFEYSLTKRGKKTGEDADLYGNDTSYDASVTKDDANDTSKQFDGKYTFTLNGKTYSIVRPDNLPEDYVFKGWAVDQAGIHLINGKINDNSEGTEDNNETGSKDKGETKDITVPVNGIKLYAAWGKPEGIKHTVTLNYHMPKTDENGNEISGSDVVKKLEFNHYHVIDEKKDIGTPTRKGYDFYGWEIKKNGTTLPYAFGNKVVEDIKLDAVWVKDTRYNGTFKHIFLKPGYTFTDYKREGLSDAQKAAMVDHVSTQTVSGLREHLRYNAEAVYSDEMHFPDKQFTSFEASKDEDQNTGEFIYQTYNTRKYRVRYVTTDKDGNDKDLLPESEVSSVNRKYDVAFYKPIEGFMPETTQQDVLYKTGDDGKQIGEDTFIFRYKDVRVLKRENDGQARPDHYTRYVFKVADGQSTMGRVVDWQNNNVADGSALVYDAIKGTKAYQMPLPTVEAKPGFEFAGWTSKIGSSDYSSHTLQYSNGLNRLPIRSEEQNSPEVIYTANFKLKAPVAASPQVLTPTEQISTTSGESAKKLITNADEYPDGATFSFADGATFDSTPGLHKIKVQVSLNGNTAEAEVLYRVLPDLVYKSDWDKFKATEYGSKHAGDYAPITFTGKNDEGTIIGHDTTDTTHPAGGTTTLTAYVYKGKDVRIRVPQAFGMDHGKDNYHYVFKGWTTGTETDPAKITEYAIDSESRYKDITVNVDSGKTYTAVYKRIDYFSSSSDGGEVPKDAVVAIFKPAPGRKWKNDGTDGPKVFYVKKGTDLSQITKTVDGKTVNVLEMLQNSLTNPTGKWSRSSMRNDGSDVKAIESVTSWIVNEPFQEFVAGQESLATPEVKGNTLFAIRGDEKTLPEPKDYIKNYADFYGDNKKANVKTVTVSYASIPPTVDKAGVYTVPLKVRVTYNDFKDPSTHKDYYEYKTVGKLKVMHDLIYGENVKDLGNKPTEDDQSEHDKIASEYKKVNFITNNSYGTMASGSRTLFYAHTNKTSGVRAPQAIGKDYDADGYHYEFVGWKKLDNFTKDNSSAETLTTDNVKSNEILQSSSISTSKYEADTTYQAVYKRVENVIDAKSKDKIPDNYVPYVFTPGFGRIWDDGSYNPKVVYFNPKSKTYTTDINKKADSVKGRLVGFDGWSTYDANGNIIEDVDSELKKNGVKKTLLFVAKQAHIKDVNVSDIVLGVGDTIPSSEKLVHSDDSTDKPPQIVGTSGNGGGYYGDRGVLYNPGITTVTVRVMQPTGRKDKEGKVITEPKDIPIHISVLPNVIAERDLPATDTKEFRYIAQNYTKVTYVVGNGGEMKSPVFTYWVRKGAKNVHMPVPDVLADKGYVFKDWSSVTKNYSLDFTKSKFATDEQKEFLAERADLVGLSFIAKQIRASKRSSFAALKNLLDLGGKENGLTFNLSETIITANFEKMAPMKFKFSGSAREGIFTNFRLQNITEGSGDANNKITVDGNEVTINELVAKGLTSVNGINATCAGIECKISGTPKIVDGKPKVELTFTTTDKYGRQAEITVEIDVISESKPAPAPVPDFAPSVIPEAQVMEPEVEQPETEESQPEPESKPVLAKTGSDTSRVASAGILSAAIAAIGLTVVKTGKHHRKRRNNK